MSIKIENLSYNYGDKVILDDIDMIINSGTTIGIIGISGTGKTTLLKLLSGLYKPNKGVISICGKSSSQEIRKNIALVMQSTSLFPASIKENITCGHEIEERMIKDACIAAQLTEWIDSLPSGLDTFVGERGSKVSGGQAQRIAIARAIVKDAPVILLDEPTSALDGDTSTALLTALKNLMLGKTVVQVSHNFGTLINCDKIYTLKGGKLYDSGTFKDI